jgi:hypothetical protein
MVAALVTALFLIAVPAYISLRKAAQATEARANLDRLHKLEFSFRSRFGHFSAQESSLGFSPSADPIYSYEILGATASEFSARAEANLDRDAVLDVWLIDETGALRHASRD